MPFTSETLTCFGTKGVILREFSTNTYTINISSNIRTLRYYEFDVPVTLHRDKFLY